MPVGRLARVRLSEVPLEHRVRAARRIAQECGSDAEAAELLAAALFPSQRVRWLPATAVDEVLPVRSTTIPLARRAAA
jgi:hypothetical protein